MDRNWKRYRKLPVVVEAIQWDGTYDVFHEILSAAGDRKVRRRASTNQVEIETLEGTMTANKGDWIIQGVAGELYPCKPAIFKATYEGCG